VIRVIAVGVDGSAASEKAAVFARDLANQTGARLVVVIAVEPPHVASTGVLDGIAIVPVQPGPEQLQAADRIAHGLGLPSDRIEIRMEMGVPTEVLQQVEADLLVIGARGVGRAEALLLGSVSERVVREARRPVTVVH
jgi:nucleotide-binding universal stress UspA family protein